MVGTVAAIVIGMAAYLALSFVVAVVMGSMLRGAGGSVDERDRADRTGPLRPGDRDGFVLPAARAPLAAAGHRDRDRVALLPRAVRARCGRSTVPSPGSGSMVPLVRRLR